MQNVRLKLNLENGDTGKEEYFLQMLSYIKFLKMKGTLWISLFMNCKEL